MTTQATPPAVEQRVEAVDAVSETVSFSLSWPQRVVIFVLFVVSWCFSYYWWVHSNNAKLIAQQVPGWNNNGYMLYDGYGLYASYIYLWLANPSAETWANLAVFAGDYIHSFRPLYPLLVAVANFFCQHIVLSSVAVNTLTSLGALLVFHRLAKHHYVQSRTELFWLDLFFLSHVSIVGMLARPMADSLALLLLLAAMMFFLHALRGDNWCYLAASAAFALAVLAKTVMILFVLAMPLALMPNWWNDKALRLRLFSIGAAILLGFVGLLVILRSAFSESGSVQFIFMIIDSLGIPTDPHVLRHAAIAGGLFLAIAFQAHPLFIAFNRRLREPQYALHVAWIAIYVLQRFVCIGFDVDHSRSRYPVPIVPSILLLALPGIRRIGNGRFLPAIALVIILMNYGLWLALLARETN